MTRAIYEEGYSKEDARLGYRTSQLERRPYQGGVAVYEIKVFEDVNVVVVGDGVFYWPIPTDLGEADIILIEGGVSTPSGSGSVQVQVAHSVDGAAGPWSDVLTTKVTILEGEYNDDETAEVGSGGTWTVQDGDWLRIDVDAAGDGAQGLAMMVALTPSPLGSVIVSGSQGRPGGIVNWTGAWTTATAYSENDAVTHNGSSYVALQSHTSDAASEPGVGVDWEDYWMLLAGGETLKSSSFQMALRGNGYPLLTGLKGHMHVPFDCVITEATLLANVVGSVVVDIWKDTYGSHPPTNADSITGATPLTLSSAIKTTDTALTGWTTALSQGDVLAFVIDSISFVEQLTIALSVDRA